MFLNKMSGSGRTPIVGESTEANAREWLFSRRRAGSPTHACIAVTTTSRLRTTQNSPQTIASVKGHGFQAHIRTWLSCAVKTSRALDPSASDRSLIMHPNMILAWRSSIGRGIESGQDRDIEMTRVSGIGTGWKEPAAMDGLL